MSINHSNLPKLKLRSNTLKKLRSTDKKKVFKVYRNVSSGFIKKKEIRNAVFEIGEYKCQICGKTSELCVDHIISVYKGFKENTPLEIKNSIKKPAIIMQCLQFS